MSKEEVIHLKKIIEASNQYLDSLKKSIKQEPAMRSAILAREKEDASLTGGAPYGENEIEANVSKQMENNPYRLAVSERYEAYIKAVSGNG